MKHEYRIIYRRDGWTQPQVRIRQTLKGAESFVARLLRGWADCAPVIAVAIERREVGSWVEMPL